MQYSRRAQGIMKNTLETILYELNPIHDLNTLSPTNEVGYIIQLPKHIIRGGTLGSLAGGAIGAISYALLGNPPKDGFISGVVIGGSAGMILDFWQYVIRRLYYTTHYN